MQRPVQRPAFDEEPAEFSAFGLVMFTWSTIWPFAINCLSVGSYLFLYFSDKIIKLFFSECYILNL